MKLHWSPRSPYVKTVVIAAHEMGLQDEIEIVRTSVSALQPVESFFADNPLNKIPALVLDDGMVLFDSRVICEHLDSLHDGATLYPTGGAERLLALRNQALGIGLMDVLLIRLLERNKPAAQQTPEVIASNQRKTQETADRLERDIAMLTDRPYDVGHLAIGTALAYLDFRFVDESWRNGRPGLAAWHADFLDRPAVRANPFADDS